MDMLDKRLSRSVAALAAVFMLAVSAGLMSACSTGGGAQIQDAAASLAGQWKGSYKYDDPRRQGVEVPFAVEMTQNGSDVSGTISDEEIGHAALSGTYDSKSGRLRFTKKYDNEKYDPVEYSGTVDASGRQASGAWHIGDYAGTWKMSR